ncbi:MAG: HAMP domain-containing histidine kinase [Lachnospiraceae bacterium]|nr:HAMP domain-containing histidine kinase [Lachnospiraceae bacterium]
MTNAIYQNNPSAPEAADIESFYRHYLSSLSHEIRNPLTLIYSSLQIIEKECPSVALFPLWSQTKADLKYTLRLLEDTSKMNCEYQLEYTTFPIQDFFSELSASVESLLRKHQIQMDTAIRCDSPTNRDIPNCNGTKCHASNYKSAPYNYSEGKTTSPNSDKQPYLYADKYRLKEALINLLINAADALSAMPASCHRRIILTVECHGSDCSDRESGICLHVRDNGPGIQEEYLNTLFDPFVTHKPAGTGLGLAIVRDIAARHGGSVSVKTNTSEPNTYTDFCLYLPANTHPL